MPINATCSRCGTTHALRDDMAGKRVRCSCGETMAVPSAAVTAVRPPEVRPAPAPAAAPAAKRSPLPLILAGCGAAVVLLMVLVVAGGVLIFVLLRSDGKPSGPEVAMTPTATITPAEKAGPDPAPPRGDNPPLRIDRDPPVVRRAPQPEAPPPPPAGEKPEALGKTLATMDRLTIQVPEVKVAEAPTPEAWEGHTATIRGVAYTDDGRFVVSVSGAMEKVEGQKEDNSIRVWDARRGKQVRKLDGFREALDAVSVSPGGRFAIFGFGGHYEGDKFINATDNHLRLWDIQDNKEVFFRKNVGDGAAADKSEARFQGLDSSVFSTAFSPDRKRVVGVANSGRLVVWDTQTSRAIVSADIKAIPRLRNDAPGGPAMLTLSGTTCIRFTPDGRWLLSGGADYTVRLWDAATGQQLHSFESHQDIVWAVAVTATKDGRPLGLSGGGSRQKINQGGFIPGARDHAIRLWDLEARREIRRFVGHEEDVAALAFCPNGRHFASAGVDKTVRLWDIDSGKLLRTYRGHTGSIRSISVSPDGRTVVSGGDDCTIRYWRLPASADDLARALAGEDRKRLAEVVADMDTMGPEVRTLMPKFMQALRQADAATAASCLTALRSLGQPDAAWVGDLRKLLASPSPAVRTYAAESLGRLLGRAAPALDDLRKALSDPESSVRRAAVAAVAAIGKETGRGANDLAQLVAREKDAGIRAEALNALLKLDPKHPTARLRLYEMIEGEDAAASAAALKSLIDLGPMPEALPTCVKAHNNPALRDLARTALEKMSAPSGPKDVTLVLQAAGDAKGEARSLVLKLLGRAAKVDVDEARPVLLKCLRDTDPRTRFESALVVVRELPIDNEVTAGVLPILIEALKTDKRPGAMKEEEPPGKDDKVEKARAAIVVIGQPAAAALFKMLQENGGDTESEAWTRYQVYLTFSALGSKAHTVQNRAVLNTWAKKEERKAFRYGTRDIFDAAFQAATSVRPAGR